MKPASAKLSSRSDEDEAGPLISLRTTPGQALDFFEALRDYGLAGQPFLGGGNPIFQAHMTLTIHRFNKP